MYVCTHYDIRNIKHNVMCAISLSDLLAILRILNLINYYTAESAGFASGPERKDFINEIGLMKTIAEGNSPHVVSLIGCVTEKEPLCLITEYLPYGDLLSYLHTIRKMVNEIT